MKKTEILTVTSNSMINTHTTVAEAGENWQSVMSTSDEDAIEKFNRQDIEVVLLDEDMHEESHKKLSAVFKVLNPSVIILNFNMENTGIATDIKAALKEKSMRNKTFVVNDDAFKGYRLN